MGKFLYPNNSFIGKTIGDFKVLRFIGVKFKEYAYRDGIYVQKQFTFRCQCIHCGKKKTFLKPALIRHKLKCKCQPFKNKNMGSKLVFKDSRNNISFNSWQCRILLNNWNTLEKYKLNKNNSELQHIRFHPEKFPKAELLILPYNTFVPYRLLKHLLSKQVKEHCEKVAARELTLEEEMAYRHLFNNRINN